MKILKRGALALGAILILGLLVSHIHILIFNDITVEPISPEDNPDFQSTELKHRPPVYLISYVDGPDETYFKNQNALALSALNKGIDFIFNYRRSHLDPEFVEKNAHILSHSKGAGYWLWKPYIILKTLKEAPENAIVIYADAAFTFHNTLRPTLEKLKDYDVILHSYQSLNDFTTEHMVKREALMRMGCDTEACRKDRGICSSFLIVKNTPLARNFMAEWLKYTQDPNILIDGPSSLPEHPKFIEHHREEAILTVVHHKMAHRVLAMPHVQFREFLFWHHRKAGQEFRSLLPRMYKNMRGIETKIINAALMIKLRAYFLPKFFTNQFEGKKKRV
jgi:hypothetical protein